MTIAANDLPDILAAHARWLKSESAGSRADLSGANLRGANLSYANLGYANLSYANLGYANLRGANLRGADLHSADLRSADLRGADLRGANLRGADLRVANLHSADLRGADLRGANLGYANLRGANLRGADLPDFQIPQEGPLTVWKAIVGGIAKIEVPADARRTACLINRKCRAEFVRVLEVIVDGNTVESAAGERDALIIYRVGKITRPDSYDDNPAVDCSHGIHFFLTRDEAEKW